MDHSPQAYNPYAPPTVDVSSGPQPAGGGGFSRQGDQLVVAKGASLPDLCIVTGQPTGGRVRSDTAQWIPPWTIVVFLLVRIVGLILMLVLRQTGKFTYFWSEEAKQRRTRGLVIGLGLVGVSVLMFAGAMAAAAPGGNEGLFLALVLGALVTFFVGLVLAIVLGRPYQVKKIDKTHIYLQVKPAFWEGLARLG